MAIEIVKPNLAAIQANFTARLYGMDLFLVYRAVAGRYPTYPTLFAGLLGHAVHHDVVTFIGALGPAGRMQYLGDIYSITYNDMVERDMAPLPGLAGFWPGWRRFTQLLKEDAQEVGEPLRFPGRTYTLPKVELDWNTLGADRAIYAIYRGDVDSMEILLTLLSQYMPETILTIPLTLHDLEGIFSLYAEWAGERFLGQPASAGARIMSKVILLADYRWYLLAGDLLAMIEPAFQEPGFRGGISQLASLIRLEAEGISVAGGGSVI